MNTAPCLPKERVYQTLKRCGANTPNGEWLARMVSSWCAGEGALPDYMGMQPEAFSLFLKTCFPKFSASGRAVSGRTVDFSRMLERDDLYQLLKAHSQGWPETEWVIEILITACLGDDHLWQDLGLWSRRDLSGLLQYNFPELAALNKGDMKWKKFLYKCLCEAEGLYLCRAPSCDVCADYPQCFGPEE